MLISKEHGGLGFSPQAQSIILGKISSRNPDAAIVVMVPNSLRAGRTDRAIRHGRAEEALSGAAGEGQGNPLLRADKPVRRLGCREHARRRHGDDGPAKGKQVLGIKLSFDKRYITLAPKATIVGLAFHLFDPQNLLGMASDIGITLALWFQPIIPA